MDGGIGGGAGAKKGDTPYGYPRRPRPLSSQLVFPPSPFLSVIVVVVVVSFVGVVVDARTFAMIGASSGSVGMGALVEQDAPAAETVNGAGEREGSGNGRKRGRGQKTGSGWE